LVSRENGMNIFRRWRDVFPGQRRHHGVLAMTLVGRVVSAFVIPAVAGTAVFIGLSLLSYAAPGDISLLQWLAPLCTH
jgi:hypothetical protein